MKNITVSVEDETYRKARIAAAARDTSVSALVRDYLKSLAATPSTDDREAVQVLFSTLDKARHFRASKRLSRDEVHER